MSSTTGYYWVLPGFYLGRTGATGFLSIGKQNNNNNNNNNNNKKNPSGFALPGRRCRRCCRWRWRRGRDSDRDDDNGKQFIHYSMIHRGGASGLKIHFFFLFSFLFFLFFLLQSGLDVPQTRWFCFIFKWGGPYRQTVISISI